MSFTHPAKFKHEGHHDKRVCQMAVKSLWSPNVLTSPWANIITNTKILLNSL